MRKDDEIIQSFFTRQDMINENMAKHAQIANQEIGEVKEDISAIRTEIVWIKDTLKTVDNRTWLILSTIVIGFLTMILINFYR